MRASTNIGSESAKQDACVIMVLYEDDVTLRRAMATCDQLTRSRSYVDFEFRWWRTQFLSDPDLAAGAAEEAAQADVFIVCSDADTGPSPQLRTWFGDWAHRRAGRPGALASLTTTSSPGVPSPRSSEALLRNLCHEANLDFLGSFPPATNAAQPHAGTETN